VYWSGDKTRIVYSYTKNEEGILRNGIEMLYAEKTGY
jgi:hypothetical protein